MPETNIAPEELRLRKVSSGIYLLMRATDKDQFPASPRDLTDEDRGALRDLAKGLITIWDGLTGPDLT